MARISRLALLLLVCSAPGGAQAEAERVFAAYDLEWQGVTIGAFETEVVTEADRYRISYRARSTGFLGWLWPFSSEGFSEGSFADMRPLPETYQVTSRRRDEVESWGVRFASDGRAVHVDLPIEELLEREPVPPELKVAPDPLALALGAIGAAGPGAALAGMSFDGKRSLRLEGACAEHLVALAEAPPGSAAAAEPGVARGAGREALACTLDGELAAGASRRWGGRTMRDEQRQPVAVWLGRGIRADGFWPVRVEAATRYGTVTVRLVSLEPSRDPTLELAPRRRGRSTEHPRVAPVGGAPVGLSGFPVGWPISVACGGKRPSIGGGLVGR